jgi:hypothetical protein
MPEYRVTRITAITVNITPGNDDLTGWGQQEADQCSVIWPFTIATTCAEVQMSLPK